MLRRTPSRLQTHDPLFIRRIKRTYANYAKAMEEQRTSPISKEAFVDIDEKGPAWYMGHMAKTTRILEEKIDDIDFFIELRDARLPFTTENPHITNISTQKPRIIVFNKADLSNEEMNRLIHRHFEDEGHYTLFTAASRTWKDTVEAVQKFVVHVLPQKEFKLTAHVGCVVGMPNVGKSTLINSLRMAHEFQFHREDFRRSRSGEEVSMLPGTTKSVKLVPMSRDPNIVLHDTPGLTLPGSVHKEAGLKLAACGILPTNTMSLTDASVARYIYEVLHAAGANEHLAECLHLPRAPLSFEDCAIMLCERSGSSAQQQMGNNTFTIAHQFIINDFKLGKLGRITLDRLPRNMLPSLGSSNSSSSRINEQQQQEQNQQQEQQQSSSSSSSSSSNFVMEHEVESFDVNYHAASKTSSSSSSTQSTQQQQNAQQNAQRTADPKFIHSAMTRIHSAPDHTDDSVISRKRGPMSRSAILKSMSDHTILRNHSTVRRSFSNKPTNEEKSSDKKRNVMSSTGRLNKNSLSQILQTKV